MSSDRFHVPPTLVDSPEDSSYSLSGKIMVTVILILFFVVVLLIALHLYIRSHLLRARRRQLSLRRSGFRRPSRIVFTTTTDTVSDPGNRGLESSVLSSLPVFLYSAKTHPDPMDCAVCLSEFEENEKGRLLPNCNHSFHIECIDMWFHSHSTCPLCRAPVEPVPEHDNIGLSERTEIEPTGASSGLCVACQHEEGGSSTSSLRSRRKGLDVTIDVPMRNELENELTPSSVGGGSRSPATRLLSARMKRLLSFGGRKTPTSERSTTPSGVESSNRMVDVDLEKGHSELTPR